VAKHWQVRILRSTEGQAIFVHAVSSNAASIRPAGMGQDGSDRRLLRVAKSIQF